MKQIAKIIAVAFAIVATAAACQKAELKSERNLVKISVNAQLPQTKADIQTDGKVFWQDSDKIAVYVEGKRFVLTLADGAGTGEATFEGEVEVEEGTDIVITNAIYPAESAAATYAIPSVPANQVIPAGASCDPKAVIMDGTVSEGNIAFSNAAGAIQIVAPEGATAVRVVSAAGTITAAIEGAGTYNVMVPAASFEGFTASVCTPDCIYIKSTDKTLAVAASKIYRIADFCTSDNALTNTIASAQDFVKWAQNAEYYAKGTTVTVTSDIDLSTLNGGELYTVKPIYFEGNLEGAKKDLDDLYVIKGYQVKASEQTFNSDDYMYLGFFGYLSGGLKYLQFGTKGGHDAVVIADPVPSVTTSNHVNIGGVVARCKWGWIEGVKSYAEITVTEGTAYKFRIGGVVGHFQSANSQSDAKYSVYKSTFDGNILVAGAPAINTSYIGGIVGYSQSGIHIRSCTNLGSIKMTAAQKYQFNVGGIVGQLGANGNGAGAIISDCRNGIVADPEADRLIDLTVIGGINTSSTTYAYLGGIAGMCYATISYCFNYANIGFKYATKEPAGGKGSPRMGGICGYLTKDQPMTMDNCANFGTVYNGFVNNTRTNVGNLIGYGQTSTGIVKNCLCAGDCITEGATRAAGERVGIIVGCQAATATYGTETEPIYVLKGIKVVINYTAGAITTVIDEDNYESKLEGQPTAGNVFHAALVSTVEEGMSKLVDRYAE